MACGWEHFPELPFWAALTREAQEVAAAGAAADRPVCATPSVAPGPLLLGGCVTALEPNLLCPAVSATGASVDRASNRDLWGYGCQVARGTSRPGARAQRICPGPRVSSGRIGRARAKPGRSRGSLSRARGGEGPRSGALTPVATPRGAASPPCEPSHGRRAAADNAVCPPNFSRLHSN